MFLETKAFFSSWNRERGTVTNVNVSCCCSVSCVQLFVTPWTATHQASLSFTISQSLFKFMSIESVMPSNHLTLCHPLLLLPSFFPRIRVFFNELSSSHQVAKVLELQLTVSYKRVISTWFSWLVCCPLFLKSNLAEIILMSRR